LLGPSRVSSIGGDMLLLGCAYEECWPVLVILLVFAGGVFAFRVGTLLLRRWHRRR
jgi:hypothetical protein